jgi:hypothetical protein
VAGLVDAIAAALRQRVNSEATEEHRDVAAHHLVGQVGRRRASGYEYGVVEARNAVMPSAAMASKESKEAFRRHVDASGIRLRQPGARGLEFIQQDSAGQKATESPACPRRCSSHAAP